MVPRTPSRPPSWSWPGGRDRSCVRNCWGTGSMGWPCGRPGRRRCGTDEGNGSRPPRRTAPIRNRPATRALPELALIRREEFEALHEEVARLPERYRVPVVLCEMEGLTYEEVARRMRCPVSTIGVRLSRARERLRSRLIRRGIVPAVGLTEALIGPGGASALMHPVPDRHHRPRRHVVRRERRRDDDGLPTSAITLTHAVLGSMGLAPLKVAASFAIIVALTTAVGLVGGQARSRPPTAPAQAQVGTEGALPTRTDRSRVIADPASQVPTPKILLATADVSGIIVPQPDRSEVVAKVEAPPERTRRPRPLPEPSNLVQLAREERARGEALFFKEWAPNDPASPHGDGLGPVFNETSCVACHGLGAPGGAGPEGKNVVILRRHRAAASLARNWRRSIPASAPAGASSSIATGPIPPTNRGGGSSSQANAERAQMAARPVAEEETVEPRIQRIAAQTSPEGRSLAAVASPGPGGRASPSRVSERNTPALFGAGRIDAISSEVLVREAKSQPAGIRGRVSRDRRRAGSAGSAGRRRSPGSTSSSGWPAPGNSASRSPAIRNRPRPWPRSRRRRGLDLTEPECDALVSYVRARCPRPSPSTPTGRIGTEAMVEGRRLFAEVGCAALPFPSLGDVRGIYSDLLLHDMGQTPERFAASTTGSDRPRLARRARAPASGGPRRSGAIAIPAPTSTTAGRRPWKRRSRSTAGQGGASARRFFALRARRTGPRSRPS